MATVSSKAWDKYISALRKLNNRATNRMLEKINELGTDDPEALAELIRYAYAIATRYGEGAAALSAEMYDALAELSGATVVPAVPAQTATYGDVAKAVHGTKLQSNNPQVMADSIGRLVKMAGVDTMQQNALRDGAEWAWIPNGDTCAFCLTLASNGWQRASRKAIKNGHAEHIHANCDCTYAIRFSDDVNVEGYDPEALKMIYDEAEGATPNDKINYLRRQLYAENKGIVGDESSKAEEFIPFKLNNISFNAASTISEAETYAKDTFVSGGFNLTGKSVSFKSFDVDIANKINKRLGEIYDSFDIPKLSSLESYGKANKRAWARNSDAPMFTTNFGNIGLNNTLIKSQKLIDKYNKSGSEAFQYVLNNMDVLTGDSKKLAEAYKMAGKSLVGNSVEDFITHEIGHHISYIPNINKKLSAIQSGTNWRTYAEKLSGYANHSFGEYFAESFNAFCRGEQAGLQPEIVEIFEGIRRQ